MGERADRGRRKQKKRRDRRMGKGSAGRGGELEGVQDRAGAKVRECRRGGGEGREKKTRKGRR